MSTQRAPDFRDRFRGSLVGTAVGDALGSPVEGVRDVPDYFVESLQVAPNRSFTDDTALTIAVARSLLHVQGFDGDHLLQVMSEMYEAEPWRGYGAGPPVVFSKHRNGMPWDQAGASLFGARGRLATARRCGLLQWPCSHIQTSMRHPSWLARRPS